MAGTPKIPQNEFIQGINIGTSVYGKPIPIVYGTNRVPGNVIWMPKEMNVKVAGQKAGKGGSGAPGPDTYYQALAIALCEGPVTLLRVWRDKDQFPNLASIPDSTYTYFNGARSQAAWSGYSTLAALPILQYGPVTVPTSDGIVTIPDPNCNAILWVTFYSSTGDGGICQDWAGSNILGAMGISTNQITFTGTTKSAGKQVVINYGVNWTPSKFAVGYGGTAYVISPRANLGSSNSLKNFSWEVRGFFDNGSGVANPADIIKDFLTNGEYGCGWDASQVEVDLGPDGTAASGLRTYCAQGGFLLAPAFTEQRPALEHLQQVLDACNSDVVWTGNQLKVVPLGDSTVGTFTPYLTPRYALTEDHFVVDKPGDDSIKVERVPDSDTYNCYPVEFTDSQTTDGASAYNTGLSEDVDQANVNATGSLRKASALSLPCITKRSVAQIISRIRAQRSCYVRNKYTFKLSEQFSLLEPLDFVTLTETNLGLNAVMVRINSIDEQEDGTLVVAGEEWPFGVATAASYTTQTGDGGGPDTQVSPFLANPPVMLVPSLTATADPTKPEVWLLTDGVTDKWGGAQVWVSWDNATYTLAGEVGACTYGYLRSSLPAGAPLDTVNTLSLDLKPSQGTLTSPGTAARDAYESLCWVGGEIIGYATATLTGTNGYNLTGLLRGLKGTSSVLHNAAEMFAKLDSNVFKMTVDPVRFGSTLYVKLVSFNVGRSVYQDISSVAVHSFALPTRAQAMPVQTTLPARIKFDRFDLAQWDLPASGPGVTSFLAGAGASGGPVLRVAGGMVQMVSKTLIPFDANKTYKLTARWRQAVAGSATRFIYFGLVGVAADGVTLVNRNGAASYASQHVMGGTAGPSAWQEVTGYWKGTAATGTNAGATSQAAGQLHSNTRYVRLLIYTNDTGSNVSGDGTQDIDALELLEAGEAVTVSGPVDGGQLIAGSVNSTQLANAAVTAAKILDGAVGGTKIADGAVWASKLSVGDFDNLWPNGKGSKPIPSGMTNARPVYGIAGSLTPTSGSAEWGAVNASAPDTRDLYNYDELAFRLPCNPGDKFFISAQVNNEETGAEYGHMGVRFLESDGALGDEQVYSDASIGGFGTWTLRGVTAPVGTVMAEFYFRNDDNTAGNGMHITNILVRRMDAGNLLVDGSIGANLVAAKAITAEKLTVVSFDNLWPNGSSEASGSSADPVYTGGQVLPVSGSAEYAWVSFISGGAHSGQNGRQGLNATPGTTKVLEHRAVALPGDTFLFEAYAYIPPGGTLGTGGGARVQMSFLSNSGTVLSSFTGALVTTAAWTKSTVNNSASVAPAGTVAVSFQLQIICGTGGANVTARFDSIYARRMADASLIVDGAITAAKIQAGSITTDRLAVGLGANLLANSDFSNSYPTAPNVTTGGILVDTATTTSSQINQVGVNLGGWSLNNTADSRNKDHLNTFYAHQNGIMSDPNKYIDVRLPMTAVDPNGWYCFSAYTGAHRAKVDLYIGWYKTDGTASAVQSITYPNFANGASATTGLANVNNGEQLGGASIASYKRLFVVAQAPSDAAQAVLILRKWDTKSGNTDSWVFCTRACIEPATSAMTGPGPWVPSAQTVITRDGIETGALSTTNYSEVGGATADTWATSRTFNTLGALVYNPNNNNTFRLVNANLPSPSGTTAASGTGPSWTSGTRRYIPDGTLGWEWVCAGKAANAGAKLDHVGTAVKTGPGDLLVGGLPLNQAFFGNQWRASFRLIVGSTAGTASLTGVNCPDGSNIDLNVITSGASQAAELDAGNANQVRVYLFNIPWQLLNGALSIQMIYRIVTPGSSGAFLSRYLTCTSTLTLDTTKGWYVLMKWYESNGITQTSTATLAGSTAGATYDVCLLGSGTLW